MVLARGLFHGDQGRVEPLALWEAGHLASGRQRIFDCPMTGIWRTSTSLRTSRIRLATEFGRELGAPMRLADMAFAKMTAALNRGRESGQAFCQGRLTASRERSRAR